MSVHTPADVQLIHGSSSQVNKDEKPSSRSEVIRPRVVRPAAVDWVKFDADLARDGSVDPVDKALYAALASFADQADRDTDPNPDGEDIPTRAVLAECIGRSVDTVDRSTKRLEAIGLIEVERRRDPNNPRRHLPSVYLLKDQEWWDERAAARAQARREAREGRGGSRTGAARGSRTDAARGSRTDAARGSRTGAAVPLSPRDLSLSQEESKPKTPTAEERENAARQGQAQAIADAWTEGTGMPPVPSSERAIADQAAELLKAGHRIDHLARVARWMGARGWRDLGYALTAKDAPKAATAPSRPTPSQPSRCDDPRHDPNVPVDRNLYDADDDGHGTPCPRCHPRFAKASA